MRNERKYKIISLMTVLLSVLLLGNCAREYFRMDTAVYRQHEEYVLKGARVYAQNCVQCHGPKGEGVTGMPLNRADIRVDYTSPAGKQMYEMIFNTLRQGRKGNDNHTHWEKIPGTKHFISYSTMPAWGRDFGGPLDDDYIKALTLFLMKEDGTQWDVVGSGDPDEFDPATAPYQKADYEPDPETKVIPLPHDNKPENAAAVALLRDRSKSQCLTCHTIGNKGGKIGPDLTYLGAWGVDEEWLVRWIKDPAAMPHDERMPIYWSANRASVSPTLNLQKSVVSDVPVQMPAIKSMSDEEIRILARYLLTLKP